MKGLTLAGILVAAVGIFILVRGLNYRSSNTVLEVGGLKASVEESRSVPAWVGVAAIVGGLVLVGAGVRKK
jgi:drug/metabolite transporter (DMT)-like permease